MDRHRASLIPWRVATSMIRMTGRVHGAQTETSSDPTWSRAFPLALAAIVLVALNLRIPTTALGPLLPDLSIDTGHGETFLSLLTTIPLALTLAIAPLVPRIAARIGRDRAVGLALVGIVAGIGIRSIPGDPTLLAGTALLGCSIAVGTVLAPATIAAEQRDRRGTFTAMYTMALSLGPALALGLTIPIMHGTGFGWRGTLLLWALCGVLALAAWIARTRFSRPAQIQTSARSSSPPKPEVAVDPRPVVRDRRVWALALYLGITSLTFYTTSTWLPTSLVLDGLDAGAAGGYASLVNIVAIPFAFLAPLGMRHGLHRVLALVAPVIAISGIVLFLTVGSSAALAVGLILGVAQGLCLGISYDQIVQYAVSPDHAASVSAFASAIGIALAAIGPLAYGFSLEASGSYVLPMCGLAVVIGTQAVVGIRSGRFR